MVPSPWPVRSLDMEGHTERQEELLLRKGQRAEGRGGKCWNIGAHTGKAASVGQEFRVFPKFLNLRASERSSRMRPEVHDPLLGAKGVLKTGHNTTPELWVNLW